MLSENQIFWGNLEKIKDSLLLDDTAFADMLGLSTKDYFEYRKNAHFLPVNCVFEFAEKLNFHFEDLLKTDFNLKIAYGENAAILPERYTYATHSELQPVKNILNYLEVVRGTRAKINLIRKFNLTDDIFNSDQQKVNIHLISDIVTYLSRTYKLTDQEYRSMGQRTPFVVKGDFLKNKLTAPKTIDDVVKVFFEECTHLFDKNYHYKIFKMADGKATIDAIPRKEVLEEMKIKTLHFGNREVCLTRMGVISSLTYFKYGLNAPISQIASLQNGNATNRYILDLSPFKRLSSSSKSTLPYFHSIYQ